MFIWDVNKAIRNFEKHGVSFEEASSVFNDSFGLDWEDAEHSAVEKRLKRLGLSSFKRIIIVIYTLRQNSYGKETIRIISARQTSSKERKAYLFSAFKR